MINMWSVNDYENFISFLNQEGINIEEYRQEFSEIIDKLNDILYHMDSNKSRFKFSKTYNIYGFSVIGVVHRIYGIFRHRDYNDISLAIFDPDNEIGFKIQEIPFEKRFVDSLHEIFMKEMANNYANYN